MLRLGLLDMLTGIKERGEIDRNLADAIIAVLRVHPDQHFRNRIEALRGMAPAEVYAELKRIVVPPDHFESIARAAREGERSAGGS
jgi:hypothetical protein